MRTLTIPIDDNGEVCNEGYNVQYKLAASIDYTDWPDALTSPIVITGLEDDVAYNVRIRRLCCDGSVSDWEIVDVTTTINSPA